MYAEGHTVTDAPRLPLNLLDALRQYEADTDLMAAMGIAGWGHALEELDDLLGPCGDEEDESYGDGEPTDAEDHEAEEDTSDGI